MLWKMTAHFQFQLSFLWFNNYGIPRTFHLSLRCFSCYRMTVDLSKSNGRMPIPCRSSQIMSFHVILFYTFYIISNNQMLKCKLFQNQFMYSTMAKLHFRVIFQNECQAYPHRKCGMWWACSQWMHLSLHKGHRTQRRPSTKTQISFFSSLNHTSVQQTQQIQFHSVRWYLQNPK